MIVYVFGSLDFCGHPVKTKAKAVVAAAALGASLPPDDVNVDEGGVYHDPVNGCWSLGFDDGGEAVTELFRDRTLTLQRSGFLFYAEAP